MDVSNRSFSDVLAHLKDGGTLSGKPYKDVPVSEDAKIEDIIKNLDNKKPALAYDDSGSSLIALRDKLWTKIGSSSFDQECLMYGIEFMVKYLGTMTWTLEADWTSCGIPIAKKDDKVSPLVVYRVSPTPLEAKKLTEPSGELKDAKHDPALVIALLFPLRVDATHPALLAELMKRIIREFTKHAPEDVDELTWENSAWSNNESLKKLACSFDLFFSKVKTDKRTSMRIVTLQTKGRSNATINSMASLMKPLDLEYKDLIAWMWLPSLQAEFAVLAVKPATEFAIPDSYIHYIVNMGIVTKSPYSVTTLPDIYSVLHVCGLTQGLPRSKNSMVPPSGINDKIMWIGAVMAYALSGGGGYRQILDTSEMTAKLAERIVEHEKSVKTTLLTKKEERSGANWMLKCEERVEEQKIRLYAVAAWESFTDFRDGSIAKHLQAKAAYYRQLAEDYEPSERDYASDADEGQSGL